MPRKTVTVAGSMTNVTRSQLVVAKQGLGTQAAVFASGPPAASAYLPFVNGDAAPALLPSPDRNCRPCYPHVNIPPPPQDIDSGVIPYGWCRVAGCDSHGFDGDGGAIGCEKCNQGLLRSLFLGAATGWLTSMML